MSQAATQRKSQSLARGALREESSSRVPLSSPPTLPGPCTPRPADLAQSPSASLVETRGVSGGRCRELSLVGAGSPQSLPVAGGPRWGGDSSLLGPPPALPAPLRASNRGQAPSPCVPPGSSPQHQRACLPPTPTEPCFCFMSVTVSLQGQAALRLVRKSRALVCLEPSLQRPQMGSHSTDSLSPRPRCPRGQGGSP